MNCPKCKTAPLKIDDGNNKCSCLKCGGLWLENYTRSTFTEIENYLTKGYANPDHDTITGLCPNGHGILIRAKVDADPTFYLEKCPKCYGIWFDKDEWQRISKELIEQNLLSIWSVSYQREQRKLKKKSEIEETYKKALGEDLYSSIIHLSKIIKEHPEKYRALELFNEQLKK